ncbi:glycoside hydrolase family 95-like protein [Kribbella qitaiheensis]|uniref:glycoside hydrolase family 95-like protein n=1 Tax=Kribbella qitaiheensis TaxID=1544730 RepID=UPI003D18A904
MPNTTSIPSTVTPPVLRPSPSSWSNPRPPRSNLLPALPTSWADGSVQGLRARGGYTVDVSWQTGRLGSATITSSSAASNALQIRLGDEGIKVDLGPGATIHLSTE